MAGGKSDKFPKFLDERNEVLNDVKQFLLAVLSWCRKTVEITEERGKDARLVITDRISQNLPSVVKSLSLLHGLHGYPDCNSNTTTGKL